MNKLNMSEWALKHRQIVFFFIVLIFVAGIFSYQKLGRMEDPDFIIRQMVVSAAWPGANARQVEEQLTDKIEKKLQDTPGLDYLKSYSKPGQAVIFVNLKESVKEKNIRPTWLEVRNMINDIKDTLPQGVVGPRYNDRFDDVYGSIYAITSDGYSYEEVREKAKDIRRELVGIDYVKKVELIGVQPEKIYIEMKSNKLAQLGIDPKMIIASIKAQNAMTPAGMIETSTDNVYLRVSGMFNNVDSLRNFPIRVNGRTFRLGDIAKIHRGYADPMEPKMYCNGKPAIGIAVSMEKGGNILELGTQLEKTINGIKNDLPLGLEIHQVSNQPLVVKESIDEFVKSLFEAVVIVLIVSFLSLGFHSGIVVALCIPLVIAGTFVGMNIWDIDLHKVSLGALIMALGLLVDDAIIAVEMMTLKLEQGWGRFDSACFAYKATAFPMLTGTLITCAGFIPIGFSEGSASEYTNSIFFVITISLLISWFVSVLVTPLLGYHLITPKLSKNETNSLHDTKFYQMFRQILVWCLNNRKLVLSITLICFLGSIFLLNFVKHEFFPPSIRPELIVEMTLPEGASLTSTEQEANDFASSLSGDPDIKSYSYYVGKGVPRFVLTLEPKLPRTNYAQFVIVAKNLEARKALKVKINKLFAEKFIDVRGHIKVIQNGPPSAYPVMLRVSGDDHAKVREIANRVRDAMIKEDNLKNVNLNWNEKSKVMNIAVDQEKAKRLGIDRQSLAINLQTMLSGTTISEYYEEDKTIGIVFRLDAQDRNKLSNIKNIPIHIGKGKFVPLDQIAKISFKAEDGLIWRYNLKPTITVQADVNFGVTGNDATQNIYDHIKSIREKLPSGYSIDIGGSLERSKISINYLLKPVPIMFLIIVILLILQLQKVPLMFITLLTAPLGIIGVSLALLITMRPMGFVADLGILALSGMIIRNSVILIDQIERHIKEGKKPWDAVIDATILRFRPILLTASAAILGMLPLIPSNFFGPMAVAIAGGLLGATILTLLVLPTMYVTWFKVEQEH